MAGDTDADEAAPAKPPQVRLTSGIGGASAPILFFDVAPVFGMRGGVCSVVLETFIQDVAKDDAVENRRVVVAHLRTTLEGIRSLKSAIDKLELLSVKPAGGTN